MTCESSKDGICLSMLCLIDTDCGARDKGGAPNYNYLYSKPATKKRFIIGGK